MEVLGILQIGHGMNLIIMEGMNMVWYSTGIVEGGVTIVDCGMMTIRGTTMLLFVNISINTK